MTYRIARAAEREWADSATVPGLRDAILIDDRVGRVIWRSGSSSCAPAPLGPPGSQRALHPFEEIYYFLSGGMLGTLDGDEVDVAAGTWSGPESMRPTGSSTGGTSRPPGLRRSHRCRPTPGRSSSPRTGGHCRGDSGGYSSELAMAITALEKHGRVDRSTWSSTRVRTLRR